MVLVEREGNEYYYNGLLKTYLDDLRLMNEDNYDSVIYIGGYEGDGKSILAEQIAFYLDPSYNIDRCTFTAQQFLKALDDAEPYQAVVYDEAQDVFDSFNRDKWSRAVKSKLTRIRKKKLYIIICAPDFFRIQKYLFVFRSRAFLLPYAVANPNIKSKKPLLRGQFAYYNREDKHKLYLRGRKDDNVQAHKPTMRGDFTYWFVIPRDLYESKKDEATHEVDVDTGRPEVDNRDLVRYAMAMLNWLHKNKWLKHGAFTALAGAMGVTTVTLSNYRAEAPDSIALKPIDQDTEKNKT